MNSSAHLPTYIHLTIQFANQFADRFAIHVHLMISIDSIVTEEGRIKIFYAYPKDSDLWTFPISKDLSSMEVAFCEGLL